jgi:hypothetical protein
MVEVQSARELYFRRTSQSPALRDDFAYTSTTSYEYDLVIIDPVDNVVHFGRTTVDL